MKPLIAAFCLVSMSLTATAQTVQPIHPVPGYNALVRLADCSGVVANRAAAFLSSTSGSEIDPESLDTTSRAYTKDGIGFIVVHQIKKNMSVPVFKATISLDPARNCEIVSSEGI